MLPTTYTEVSFAITKNNSYDIRFDNDTKVQTTDDVTVIQSDSKSLTLQYEFEFKKYMSTVIEQQLNFDFKDNHKIITTTLNNIQFGRTPKIFLCPQKENGQTINKGIYIKYQSNNIITGFIGEKHNTTFKLSDKPVRIQWNITCDLKSITALFKGYVYIHVMNEQLYIDSITFKPLNVLIKN